MLSRRHLLVGLPCAAGAAAVATRLRAETADGFIVLRAEEGEARLPERPAVPIWGFGGAVPGPVIRVRRGDELKVRLVNALGEPTAIHWHGVRLANAMDGAPPLTQAPVAPGASFDYRFTAPDAGTFWYRAHQARQQERGLFGALIVEEPVPPTDRDQVLVFADLRPDAGGAADPAGAGGGGGSRLFTINGASSTDIPVRTNERLRLRFVNASATWVMRARIDGHRLVVMALDGQPAEPFVARDSVIVLGPGNRADVFVDALGEPGDIAPIMFETGGAETQLARLVYERSEPVRAAPPAEVVPLATPPSANARATDRLAADLPVLRPLPERMNFPRALRVTLPIGSANAAPGAPGLQQMPLFLAERGRTIMMALDNRDAGEHSVHVHGHHFRLLDRLDDGWKPYWLDTVVVGGRQIARIAFVADNPGRWLIEQNALAGAAAAESWFQVK